MYWKAEDLNIEQMAEDGDKYAQECLGWILYNRGKFVKDNFSKAKEWYRRAAEQGHVCAQSWFGYRYLTGSGVDKNYSIAKEWYHKAAEQGYADAQFNIGVMYEYGDGVDKNYSTAVEWYCKAAEQGDVDAQMSIDYLTKRLQKSNGAV